MWKTVQRALRRRAARWAIYLGVRSSRPIVRSRAAAKFAQEGNFDGFSVGGGGSVMDTTKAANLYATGIRTTLAYVNAPIAGWARRLGRLPHIACPTTCGTGSEVTGIAIFDLFRSSNARQASFASPAAVARAGGPEVTHTLSPAIIAANGFDALSHALESYTARPHSAKAKNHEGFPTAPNAR